MTWPKTCLGTGERDRPGRSVRRLAEQRVRQIPLTGCCARASACQLVGETPIRAVETELPVNQLHRSGLVPHFINTTTFAARDFWPRRDASDAHTLQGSVRSEQRRLGQKEPPPGGLRAFRFWRRCSSVTAPLRGMLPRRASPEPKIDATNVLVFMKWGTSTPKVRT